MSAALIASGSDAVALVCRENAKPGKARSSRMPMSRQRFLQAAIPGSRPGPGPAISMAGALPVVIGLAATTCGPTRMSGRLLFAILHD
jgi:hypothetical protein